MALLLKRSVKLYVYLKQTASYCSSSIPRTYDWKTRKGDKSLFHESQSLANNLLLQGALEENRVASPVSLHLLLSLLAAGSGVSGRRQFLDFFDVDSMHNINDSVSLLNDVLLAERPDSAFGPRIRSSTSLWHHHSLSFHPFFLHTLHSPHRVSLIPLDFHSQTQLARQQINSRVEDDTNGLIKDLISKESLSNSSAKLVFTNALHFKGEWNDDMLNPKKRLGDDYLRAENLAIAEIFAIKRNIVGHQSDSFFKFGSGFREPCKDKRGITLSYCYPIPRCSFSLFHNETLMEVAGVKIPKFDVSSEVDASTRLRALGITLPFSRGGLTQTLSSSEELYVFKMLQKTFININEQGTEAATATTAIVMSGRPPYLPNPPVEEKLYQPVIFHFELSCDDSGYKPFYMARVGLKVFQLV